MFNSFETNNGVQKSKQETGNPKREIPLGVVEMHKTQECTNQLERRLEEEKANGKVRKQNLAKRIVEELRSRGKKMTKIVILLTALGLAGCYQKEKIEETPATSAQNVESSSVAKKTEKTVKLMTQEERQQIIKETGIDVIAIAETAHFDAQLQVLSQNGKYILHIGKSHYVSGYEDKVKEAHAVAQIQRNIEKILYELSKKGITNIFDEGYTQELHQKYPDRDETPKRLRKFIKSVVANEECFDILASKCKEETEWFTKHPGLASDSLTLRIRELFKKKALELKGELEAINQFSEKMEESFTRTLEEFKPSGTLSKLGDDAIYLLGIEDQLEYEGVIKILPAETKEGNKGAFKYEPELRIVESNYFNADVHKIGLEEIKDLAKKYHNKKILDEKATMDDREDIAVAIIRAESEGKTNRTLIPVLFGSAHDFKDNVKDFNALGPENKLGLIRLSPQKDKTPYETRKGN